MAKKFGIAGALSLAAYASFNQVEPQEFGLRDTAYMMVGDILKPSVYFQVPFLQYTHKYHANTQTMEVNAGGGYFSPFKASTADRNPLMADVALHYRIVPDREKLKFHRWGMEKWLIGGDGYWEIRGMLNTSANAILGQKTMAKTLADPDAFIKALYADLSYRLQQNNFPVEIQSVELKGFKTFYAPVRDVSYGFVQNPAVNNAFVPPQPK